MCTSVDLFLLFPLYTYMSKTPALTYTMYEIHELSMEAWELGFLHTSRRNNFKWVRPGPHLLRDWPFILCCSDIHSNKFKIL